MARADAGRFILPALLIGAATLLHAEGDEYAFMPPGGRGLMERLLAAPGADSAEIAARAADRDTWTGWGREAGLEEREAETLGAYAALNFPLGDEAGEALASGDLTVLPSDGKDLAIAQCQFCHSFFTGYLMQNRDETSWRGTFKAPFHAEIPMSDTERDTFAAYSALNMPLKFEDVPTELRF